MTNLAFAAPTNVPAMATIAIDACEAVVGGQLALALADLGANVVLQGKDHMALEKLQRIIAARWGRAAIHSATVSCDAAIGIEIDAKAAIARIASASETGTETGIVLIQSSQPDQHAALQSALSGLEPARKMHAITLPSSAAGTDINYPVLTRICALLASDAGRAIANQHIVLQKPAATNGATATRYPDMTVCAPTIVPIG